MNSTVDLTAVPVLAVAAILAILLFAAVGIVYIGERIYMGYRGEMRHRRAEVESEPEAPAEPVAEPEPAPAAVEVVVMRQVPDLLPLPDPSPEDVPLFRQIPVPLPAYDSYGFRWKLPREPFPTGSFPVVVLDDDIEGYQVSAVPPKQREGFAVTAEDRRRLSISDELIAEVSASLPSSLKADAEVSA